MNYVFYSSSLFTNSNWFTFDDDRGINDRLAASVPSSSSNSEETSLNVEVSDEVLTGEATGIELQLESVCLENAPAEEIKELAVAKHTYASTDGDKLLFTDEENSSKESEASKRPVVPQGEQVDMKVVDADEVSGEEMGTERTSDERASTSEPDIASANSVDMDSQSVASAGFDESVHDSGKVLQVEEKTEDDSGKEMQVEGDLSMEVDVEKKPDVATTKE
jgi:serine/threonine-protein phosphatase 6 regulatory subunit 3